MQITSYKPRYIERIITTEEGVFSARFVVVSEGNSFKLKLVEMVPIEEKSTLAHAAFLLSAPKIKQVVSEFRRSISVVSPFSNHDFFISQLTRAPSL